MLRYSIIALAMVPVLGQAGDRLSYLTVDQDNHYTAVSTIVCKIASSRMKMTNTYSGTVTVEWQPVAGGGYSISMPFEVSALAPIFTETAGYTITATLSGGTSVGRVLVIAKTTAPLSPSDVVLCNANIDVGPLAAPLGTSYAANMRYVESTYP